jgi:mRNA interferase MazF
VTANLPQPTPSAHSDEPDAPEVANRIKAAPRIGNVYWCDFHQDARLPEFWKKRPVVVISARNSLQGPILVVPLTTKPQGANSAAHALPANPIPKEKRASWAVCNHIYTISCSRLSPIHGAVPKVQDADLQAILGLAHASFPTPRAK